MSYIFLIKIIDCTSMRRYILSKVGINMRTIILTYIIFILAADFLHAQFSMKPKPLDEAKVFLLADFGYSYRVNTIEGWLPEEKLHLLNSELGLMVNINSNFAIGSNFQVSIDLTHENDLYIYGKLRFRKWFSNGMSLDFAPGINLGERRFYTGSMDFHFFDWLAITAQIEEEFRWLGRSPDKIYPIYLGIKFSSIPGLGFNGGGLIVGIIYATLWIIAGGSGN